MNAGVLIFVLGIVGIGFLALMVSYILYCNSWQSTDVRYTYSGTAYKISRKEKSKI